MSRIDLDAADRRRVAEVRRLQAGIEPDSRPADEAAARVWEANRMSTALACIDTLLGVIDGGESNG